VRPRPGARVSGETQTLSRSVRDQRSAEIAGPRGFHSHSPFLSAVPRTAFAVGAGGLSAVLVVKRPELYSR
jgi:hypothetical protein